jgi:hypothetical protein
LDDIGRPENIRFSFRVEVGAGDELKICVIENDEQQNRELLLEKRRNLWGIGRGKGMRWRMLIQRGC